MEETDDTTTHASTLPTDPSIYLQIVRTIAVVAGVQDWVVGRPRTYLLRRQRTT